MKTYGLVLLGAMAIAAGPVWAQEPPPAVPPPAQQPPAQTPPPVSPTVPVAAPAPSSVAPAMALEPGRRREQIRMMEGTLAMAVRNGAEEIAKVIRSRQPGLMLFTGDARAKGFLLDGYGVFFHVEIPGVRPGVASIVEMIEQQRNDLTRNAQPRSAGERPMVTPFDPNASYTEAVQRQLIDAMLSFRIDLQPDEWLTVAARDADGPMLPGEIYESFTLILRIKGSDLTEFAAGRLSRDEARRRVEVREF